MLTRTEVEARIIEFEETLDVTIPRATLPEPTINRDGPLWAHDVIVRWLQRCARQQGRHIGVSVGKRSYH